MGRRVVFHRLFELSGFLVGHLYPDLAVHVIKVRLFVLLVAAFPNAAIKHMRNKRGRVNVGTPLVIDVSHPIHHTHGLAIDIYLETLPIV